MHGLDGYSCAGLGHAFPGCFGPALCESAPGLTAAAACFQFILQHESLKIDPKGYSLRLL